MGVPRLSTILRLQAQAGNQATHRFLAQRARRPAPVATPGAFFVQRFEAGEHMQLGEVDPLIVADEKKYAVPAIPGTWTVRQGEMPPEIARDLHLPVELLIARNAALYKSWKTPAGTTVRGFKAGTQIVVPGPSVADLAKQLDVTEKVLLDRNAAIVQTLKDPQSGKQFQSFDRGSTVMVPGPIGKVMVGGASPPAGGPPQPGKTVKIQGIDFSYGEVIAMGDFYKTPDDIYKAAPTELTELKRLMAIDRANPGSVTTAQWDKATNGRYVTLATANAAHFGPGKTDFTAITGSSGANHRTEWEKYHAKALELAQSGDKDRALTTNAFGDHFLTDAFASGHLFNKEDVMARFAAAFDKGAQTSFFEAVAQLAWADSGVATLFSGLRTPMWKGGVGIVNASRFASVLEAVYEDAEGREQVLSTVAKVIHDKLNKEGVEVENAKGQKWTTTGDAHMNDDTRKIGQTAVAQSQVDVLNNVGKKDKLDLLAIYKAVWDYTPVTTAGGTKAIHDAIQQLTNAADAKLRGQAAQLIITETPTIAQKLLDRGKLVRK